MAHFFRQPDRRQRFLLPVDMMDWLPEGDIVHVIVDAVGLMDLSDFEATCKVGRAGGEASGRLQEGTSRVDGAGAGCRCRPVQGGVVNVPGQACRSDQDRLLGWHRDLPLRQAA